jgi:hypothetical protein
MKIKRQRDFWCGLVFAACGLGFAWAAGTWPLGHWSSPGPGFFGLCLALMLTMVGGGVLFTATTFESVGGDPIGPLGSRPLALLLLAMIAFGLGLPRLGLIPTVLLVVLFASVAAPAHGAFRLRASASGRRLRWRGVLVNAVVSCALAWVLCHLLLKLSVPLWPLPVAAWPT